MSGGAGDDGYVVDEAGDVVTEASGEGRDNVTSSISYTLTANVEDLLLAGSAANGTGNGLSNVITGTNSANTLSGLDGDDTLYGLGGADTLLGGIGNDTLYGGAGRDLLNGGDGNDRLAGGDDIDVFTLGAGNDTILGDLGMTKVSTKFGMLALDIVRDFDVSGNDTIDLSAIDAVTGMLGDQAFRFIGSGANKNAGDLSFKSYTSINGAENALGFDIDGVAGASGVSGPVTVVFGNIDGGNPDFAIVLLGHSSVLAGDFVL